jgi:murein DD-endopeptidase MepM/ murein hydrolase activator NlpD
MKSGNQANRIVEKLRNKFRLIIVNDSTFEEKFSLKLSRLNVIALIASAIILVSLLLLSIIIYTPAKELIPGYSDVQAKRNAKKAIERTQMLEEDLQRNEVYLDRVRQVLQGNILPEEFPVDSSKSLGTDYASALNLNISQRDSALRASVTAEEKYNLKFEDRSGQNGIVALSSTLFFSPIRGKVSSSYNIGSNHLGTDIVAPDNEVIKATLDGTVLLATWTSNEGHIIALQHSNDLISVYKHNSTLLKKAGESVKAGDSIAIIGNSGDLTDGPHLHFELWHRGIALDPEKYLVFN